MKKLYLIATAEAIPRNALTEYLGSMPECGEWFYSIPNTTFVFASITANDLSGKIRNQFPGDNRIFVTEVPLDNCQGWIPGKHWDLIYANDIVHDYELQFSGYWVAGNENLLPSYPGIYCVYACVDNESDKTVSLRRLLYIGRAENINERHKRHERFEDWNSNLNKGETLCYSCAALRRQGLPICEAAMIYQHKPICNKSADGAFWHDKTRVKTSGCNKFLLSEFTVLKTRI